MSSMIFSLICVFLGIYMLFKQKTYTENDISSSKYLPMYIKNLRNGGIAMILLGLSILLDKIADYL